MAWHAELVLVQLRLRRYAAADPAAAFEQRQAFNGVASAEIRNGEAWVDGMLVTGPPLTRHDRRQIEALLRKHGAVNLQADRHGRLVQLGGSLPSA